LNILIKNHPLSAGSFGTKLQTPLSDLDIGVLYDGNVPVMEELK